MKIKKNAKARAKAASKTTPEPDVVAVPKGARFTRVRSEIALDALKVAPWNPRGKVTPESVADLAASIASVGLIQPLVVMEAKDGASAPNPAKGGAFIVIAGHRRMAAAKAAGLEKVPCDILKGVDEGTARRMTFLENLQRADADPLLESELVKSLVAGGMTHAEIAAETGRGREWVARRLNVSNLSASWRRRVKDGERIATDCLVRIAAYPEAVQEKMKGAGGKSGGTLRWSDVRWFFERETCDLKGATFDRKDCRTCPNNTGCSPELFDWDGKPTALGKCMDAKCYRRRVEQAAKDAIEDARRNGAEVRETKERPYTVDLQSKPDSRHNTLYVWKDYSGETQVGWGKKPKSGQSGGGLTEKQKDERRTKIAANKARRKLAEWCEGNLAGVIAAAYTVDVQIALAFQRVFDIGSSWRVFGSQTNVEDAARAYLLDPGAKDFAPMERWARLAASDIAAKVAKPEVGAKYAELLIAILPPVAKALTDEERQLVAPDETILKLREPAKVKWTSQPTDDDAEDAMLAEAEEAEDESEEEVES